MRPTPQHAALGGLIALAVAIGIGRFIYTPILPIMLASLHLSVLAAGLIASSNYLGYLLGALAVSSSRLPGSQRVWLGLSLLASAAATALMALPSGLAAFIVLRLAGGVASAFIFVFANTAVLAHLERSHAPDSPPRKPTRLASVLFAGVGVGILLSAALVSVLDHAGAGWRLLWVASGGLAFIGAVVAFALIPAASPERSRTPGPAENTHTPLLRLVISYGLFGFGYIITATFIVAMVRQQASLRSLEPIVWVVFGLAATPSVSFWLALTERFGIVSAYALACLVEAGGVAASTVQSAAGIMIAAILVGGTFMGLTAMGLLQARRLAPANPRRAIALMTTGFGVGQIIGPSLAGAIAQHLGSFTPASALAAAALVIAAALAPHRSGRNA